MLLWVMQHDYCFQRFIILSLSCYCRITEHVQFAVLKFKCSSGNCVEFMSNLSSVVLMACLVNCVSSDAHLVIIITVAIVYPLFDKE